MNATLLRKAALSSIVLFFIASCSYLPQPTSSETAVDQEKKANDPGSFFTGRAESGVKLDDIFKPESGGNAMPVNALLWRASLETVSVMPLASVDTFGGTIITEWYMQPGDTTKRIKVAIFILDQELRSDAIKVEVYVQQRPAGTADWQDDGRDSALAIRLEELILTRAREIRSAGVLETN